MRWTIVQKTHNTNECLSPVVVIMEVVKGKSETFIESSGVGPGGKKDNVKGAQFC